MDFQRFEALKQRAARLSGMRDNLSHEISTTQQMKSKLKAEKSFIDKEILVMKKLIDTATHEDLTRIGEFVTSGLKTVLADQDIQCIFNTLTKGGSPTLSITGKQGDVEGPFLRHFGGGTWNVVSFLLRLIVIMRLNMKKRLFLDESFSKVSAQYQSAMSTLVKTLSSDMGFTTLLVTHQPAFADEADRVYEAKLVKGALALEKVS